ncbi:MAG TPA: phosphoribosylglycinamide formyltransferase [Nitrososphaeraceae archaeon]|nr:phosphoribosylglycinamide formyltransferase [Nitrososphaeraceae archaeon]
MISGELKEEHFACLLGIYPYVSTKIVLINLGILISGRGSNMAAILSAIKSGNIKNINPAVVISNRTDAAGLKVAREDFGIPTEIVQSQGLKGWDYDKNVISVLKKYDVRSRYGLVCLAGFMRLISAEFVKEYPMQILNIHPSLLPSFPGLHAQKQAIEYGVKVSGCTVHFVDQGLDSGPIVVQRAVEVMDSDTEEELSERILRKEHELYPEAVRLFAEGKIKIMGRKVLLGR